MSSEIKKSDSSSFPTYDTSVWLRTCDKEIVEPVSGVIKGTIPSWINGSLLRNGSGSTKVGEDNFNHLFDCSALLHRFNISEGQVTYQCRFLQSETYKKNHAANRIVVEEFATAVAPDPCQSIFSRFSSAFNINSSDNAFVSIYPFNDEFFAVTEAPVIHKIDPKTLETLERVKLVENFGILSSTSHPHVMADGTVYNLGFSFSLLGPVYNIISFPKGEKIFDDAKIVAKISPHRKLNPSYMHTFGVTENFFIIVEQPLGMSAKKLCQSRIFNKTLDSCLVAFENDLTYIHVIERATGKLRETFHAEAFYYFHIINQFERDGHVVIDISCYKDPELINCMYIESIRNGVNDPFSETFKTRPMRFVMPLERKKAGKSAENLVKLENSEAEAFQKSNGTIFCKPEVLCDVGCELSRINYEKFLGRDYQFFYAISPSAESNKVNLVKVDVKNKSKISWGEENCYPSEPVFLAAPGAQAEDDGVVLASMIWGNGEENRVGLLVLDAKNMVELGRCEFNGLPGPIPKCFHGCFADGK